ncbi:hypothetical protein [Morganella psychrotolerans]|uniref:Uncharacterized protein n=1 Tax=Morganella psychrotolerans TaxID=368603 RepID=A0A1B8H9P8_9GAMM|nr:hypothetical protein [Morganella psychrotolerans]OBU05805.1 hypothetical protein AYY17_05525 [Morganella psychrotolerans]
MKIQPESADTEATRAIEQLADIPAPYSAVTPSTETRYQQALTQADNYHREHNPVYARLYNACPSPVIPAGLFNDICPAIQADDKNAGHIQRAMKTILRENGLTCATPSRFLLLSDGLTTAARDGDTAEFPGLTLFAPVKECVCTASADEGTDAAQAWSILKRWAEESDPVYIFGLTHHMERRGQHTDRQAITGKLQLTLRAASTDLREIYSVPEHPLHYISCKEGYFHIPVFARFALIGEDGNPAAPGKCGLLQLETPLLSRLSAQRLLTTDVCEQGTGCPCGCVLPRIHYHRTVVSPENHYAGGML